MKKSALLAVVATLFACLACTNRTNRKKPLETQTSPNASVSQKEVLEIRALFKEASAGAAPTRPVPTGSNPAVCAAWENWRNVWAFYDPLKKRGVDLKTVGIDDAFDDWRDQRAVVLARVVLLDDRPLRCVESDPENGIAIAEDAVWAATFVGFPTAKEAREFGDKVGAVLARELRPIINRALLQIRRGNPAGARRAAEILTNVFDGLYIGEDQLGYKPADIDAILATVAPTKL